MSSGFCPLGHSGLHPPAAPPGHCATSLDHKKTHPHVSQYPSLPQKEVVLRTRMPHKFAHMLQAVAACNILLSLLCQALCHIMASTNIDVPY